MRVSKLHKRAAEDYARSVIGSVVVEWVQDRGKCCRSNHWAPPVSSTDDQLLEEAAWCVDCMCRFYPFRWRRPVGLFLARSVVEYRCAEMVNRMNELFTEVGVIDEVLRDCFALPRLQLLESLEKYCMASFFSNGYLGDADAEDIYARVEELVWMEYGDLPASAVEQLTCSAANYAVNRCTSRIIAMLEKWTWSSLVKYSAGDLS